MTYRYVGPHGARGRPAALWVFDADIQPRTSEDRVVDAQRGSRLWTGDGFGHHLPNWSGPSIDSRDPYTGHVTGRFNATGPDGDPLTYGIASSGPWYGTMTLDPATGNYTYTPYLNADQGVDSSEVITISVNDGTHTIYRTVWLPTFRDDLAPL